MFDRRYLVRASTEFDWTSYLYEHHAVKRGGENELRICCMNCGDTKFKLYVNPNKGVFQCFKCGFRTGKEYSILDFIALTEDISLEAAYQRVKEMCADTAPTDDDIRDRLFEADREVAAVHSEVKTIELPSGLVPLTAGKGDEYWDYLFSRGLTEKEVVSGKVHFTPLKSLPVYGDNGKLRGNLSGRVLWPVYGSSAKLVSYQARAITQGTIPKYLAAPGSDLSKTLWPFVPPRNNRAYLVEGILDAYAGLRIKQSFYSCFGKKVSKTQIDILKAWGTEEVVVFFDKSDAYAEIVKAVEELKMHFPRVYVLDNQEWPTDVDPGDCLKLHNGNDLLQNAVDRPIDVYSIDYDRWKIISKVA